MASGSGDNNNLSFDIPVMQASVELVCGTDTLRTETDQPGAFKFKSLAAGYSWNPVFGRYLVIDIAWRFNNSGGQTMPRISF